MCHGEFRARAGDPQNPYKYYANVQTSQVPAGAVRGELSRRPALTAVAARSESGRLGAVRRVIRPVVAAILDRRAIRNAGVQYDDLASQSLRGDRRAFRE
jgi:hypothetical protein